jgi:hypothetical protein
MYPPLFEKGFYGVIPEELKTAPPGKKDNVRIKVRLPIS